MILLEEQTRGWLARIAHYADVRRQVPYYRRLVGLSEFYAGWNVLPFDELAAEEFLR